MKRDNNAIKKYRESVKLTVRELSVLLSYHLGKQVSPSTVSLHETGKRNISDRFITGYSRVFKVDSHKLFKR